jgi:hypothetical protein
VVIAPDIGYRAEVDSNFYMFSVVAIDECGDLGRANLNDSIGLLAVGIE